MVCPELLTRVRMLHVSLRIAGTRWLLPELGSVMLHVCNICYLCRLAPSVQECKFSSLVHGAPFLAGPKMDVLRGRRL